MTRQSVKLVLPDSVSPPDLGARLHALLLDGIPEAVIGIGARA